MTSAFAPCRQSASHADKKIDQEYHYNDEKDHQFRILPPHPSSQAATAHAEVARTTAQSICFVHEQVDSLATL